MFTFNHELDCREASTLDIQEFARKGPLPWIPIDIRSPEQFALGHIPEAENMPFETLPLHVEALRLLAETKPLLIYCEHGVNSRMACVFLLSKNINNILHMKEGFCLWSNDAPVQ